MHKAFPQQEGLNGGDGKVFLIFFTSVRISTTRGTRHTLHGYDETTKHIKPKPQKGGNVVIPVYHKYQRLKNYGYDPLEKPIYGYNKDV